jgi:DNA-binding response OmpR family regulator
VINLDARTVSRAGRDIKITAREFSLLECMALHAGAVVTRTELSAHIWDDNHDPFSNMVDVLVSRVRRKVDDGHEIRLIQTLRGTGYRLGT